MPVSATRILSGGAVKVAGVTGLQTVNIPCCPVAYSTPKTSKKTDTAWIDVKIASAIGHFRVATVLFNIFSVRQRNIATLDCIGLLSGLVNAGRGLGISLAEPHPRRKGVATPDYMPGQWRI